nr:B3 domain-containing protein Os01g0234100-like [Ipomoea batatas]
MAAAEFGDKKRERERERRFRLNGVTKTKQNKTRAMNPTGNSVWQKKTTLNLHSLYATRVKRTLNKYSYVSRYASIGSRTCNLVASVEVHLVTLAGKGLIVQGYTLQVKSPTLIRAEEVQSSLGQEYPTFLKLLVRSHVGSCFWMGLPVPFCKKYLSRKDTTVVVENESGEEFEIKYIAEKTGLSAGWRKFVAAHKLVEGDVLIFQLTGPDRFKVYVIRTNDLTDVDGALSLLNLEVLTKQNDAAEATNPNNKRKKRQKSLPLTVVQKKKHKAQQLVQLEEQSGNDSDEVASETPRSPSTYEENTTSYAAARTLSFTTVS